MKIVIGLRGHRVLDERRESAWCGQPDEKIGVGVFHAPHSARSAGRISVWKRESQSILTETASGTRGR
jgi:hypothetical protein